MLSMAEARVCPCCYMKTWDMFPSHWTISGIMRSSCSFNLFAYNFANSYLIIFNATQCLQN